PDLFRRPSSTSLGRRLSVARCGLLIRADGLGKVLAADETVSFDLARLRLVEEVSRELIRLGGQGLLAARGDRRVRLIQGRAQLGELTLVLLFGWGVGCRCLVFGLGDSEEGAGRNVVRFAECGDAFALFHLSR